MKTKTTTPALRRFGNAATVALIAVGTIAILQTLISLYLIIRQPATPAPTFVRVIYLASSGVALLLASGLFLYVVRPSQERVRALIEALEERRARFAAVFDQSYDPMALYAPDGTIIRGNQSATELLGYGPELIGAHFSIHVAPDMITQVKQYFAMALRGEGTEFETTFVSAQGRRIPALVTLSPMIVRGEVVSVVGMAKDLTQQRQAERALLNADERFRSLFERNGDPIAELSLDGRYIRVNESYERATGYATEELVGKTIDRVVAPESQMQAHQYIRRAKQGEPVEAYVNFVRKDGAMREAHVRLIPIIVEKAPAGVYAVVRDITETRQRDLEFVKQAERVRSLYVISTARLTPAEQIGALLAFGARSLDMTNAYVTHVAGEDITSSFAYRPVPEFPLGKMHPFSQSLTQHVYGSSSAFAIDDLTAPPWNDHPVHALHPWTAYIAAGITVAGEAYGALGFMDERPRAQPFSEGDRDFVRLMSTFVGTAIEHDRRSR